jgi:TP901 family phage tail tape measure protein
MKIDILIGANLDGLRRALGQVKTDLEATGKVAERAIGPASAAFTGLSLAVGGTLKAFADFERVMNEIQAVSGATTQELEAMRAVALDLGAKTKFSAKQAAEGMAELSKAGFTAGETIRALPGVLAAAAAGGTSIAQAAELAGGTLRGFGLAADQAGRVADVLAQTANLSAVGFGDLQLSMKYIAPVAAGTNQSLEGMAAALAIMGNQMIKGEQAGTTMRAVLTRLADPPKEAAEALSKLGISVQDTQGKMRAFDAILGDLRTATSKMTDTQRAATFAQVAGTEAMSGLLALVRTSAQDYDTLLGKYRDVTGVAQQMADVMNQGLGPALEQLGGSIETLAIQFGGGFAPAVKAAAQGVSGFADEIGKAPKPVQDLATGLTAAALATTGATAALAATGLAVRALAVGVAALSLELAPVLAVLGAIGLAAGAATVAFKNAGDASANTAAAHRAHQAQVDALVAEYDRLQLKVAKTAAEKARMAAITEQLSGLIPGVASAFNTAGKATAFDREMVLAHNAAVREQIRLATIRERQAREAAIAVAGQRAGEATTIELDLREAEQRLAEARTRDRERFYDPTGRTPTPASDATRRYEAEVKDLRAQLQGAKQALSAANAEARALMPGGGRPNASEVAPKAAPALAPRADSRGAVVSVPTRTRARGAGRAGSAANPAVDPSLVNRELERLTATYERAINLNDRLYEGGVAGEIKLLEAFRDRLKATEMAPGLAEAAAKQRQQVEDRLAIARKKQGEELAAQTRAQTEHEANLARVREATAQRLQALALQRLPLIERERAALEATYQTAITKADEQHAAEVRQADAIAAKGKAHQVEAQRRREAAQVALTAAKAIADAERELDAEEIAKRNTQAFRAFQAQVVALSLDPSWERIANFIRDLAGNEDQLKRVMVVLQGIGDKFNKAGGGAEGLAAGLTEALQQGNLLAIGLTLVANAIGYIASEWGKAEKAAAAYAEKQQQATTEALRLRYGRTKDPNDLMALQAQERADRDGKLWAELQKQVEDELMAAGQYDGQSLVDSITFANGTQGRALNQSRFWDAVKRETERRLNSGGIGAMRTEQDAAAAKALEEARTNAPLTGQKYGLVINQSVPEDVQRDLDTYADTLDKLIALEDELAGGARNNRGERISFQARLAADLAELRTEHQQRLNDLLKQETDLRKQIADLARDEAEQVQAILNEGIAQRQRSEAQDKAARIARVQDDAQERRTALTEQLGDLQTAREVEVQQYEDAKARTTNLANERVAALQREQAELAKQADLLRLTLGVEKDLTAEVQRQRDLRAATSGAPRSSGGGSSGGSTGGSGGGSLAAGTVRGNVGDGGKTKVVWDGTRWNSYHTGGIVPGRGEQPATVLGGEMVLSASQQARLWSLITAGGGGGGVTVGQVGITIHTTPGQDPRAAGLEAGRAAWEALNQRLRRAGPGFRV